MVRLSELLRNSLLTVRPTQLGRMGVAHGNCFSIRYPARRHPSRAAKFFEIYGWRSQPLHPLVARVPLFHDGPQTPGNGLFRPAEAKPHPPNPPLLFRLAILGAFRANGNYGFSQGKRSNGGSVGNSNRNHPVSSGG